MYKNRLSILTITIILILSSFVYGFTLSNKEDNKYKLDFNAIFLNNYNNKFNIKPMGLSKNSPDLFITLENAGNDAAFGYEDENGIYDKYQIADIMTSSNGIVARKIKVMWSANINDLGTSNNGRKIIITVPNGFSITSWNSDILDKLINKQVETVVNSDNSISYVLKISNNAVVNGQMAQQTDINQNSRTIFETFKPGKTYDLKIEYFTDESTTAIKTDVLKFLPKNQDIATWKVDTTLNNIQYTPDNTGKDGIIKSLTPFSFFSTVYANISTSTVNSSNYLFSDYQAGVQFGKYFYSSISNPVVEIKKGKPTSIITDYNSNGSATNIPNLPGMMPALTITKTSGYIQKGFNIDIPLPAYVNDSSESLKLYDRKDGNSKQLYNGASHGTTVWFRPDGTDDLYRLPDGGTTGTNGLYYITYDKEKEVLNIRLAPEYYLNNYYYLDANTTYLDLLSKPGKFYINIFMTADLTKLFNKNILGSKDENSVGKNNVIKGSDKVKLEYKDENDNPKIVQSEDVLKFNFKANEPIINLSSHLSKNNNTVTKQAYNSVSKTVIESAALSDLIVANLLTNNINLGGKYSNYDLARGQTNIYFEYNYEQAYSPIVLRNLFNGINTIGQSGKAMKQNNVYKITITNASNNKTRFFIVDDKWKDENGEFSNIVTTEQLNLDENEYVSQIYVTNEIAMVSGGNFADGSTSGFGIFSADYLAKEEVYVNQVLQTLPDKYEAKVNVKFGSDQYKETTMVEKVILTKSVNNFVIGNDVKLNENKTITIPVNDNESLYTLYNFYIKKFQDTKIYDENSYPTLTLSGDGVMLSDIIAFDRNNSYTGDRANDYYRDSLVPISYINQDNQTISLKDYDWKLQKYNLGIENLKMQYIEGRLYGSSIPVGYNFKNVLKDNNDKYAKSIKFEIRINHLDANNNNRFAQMRVWLAASKLKPGYLNYDNVVGKNGVNDIGNDNLELPGKFYNVEMTVDSNEAFVPFESGNAIRYADATCNHILKNISKNTFRVVYGIKNDKIIISDLDHYINPIDERWTGTDGDNPGVYSNQINQLTPTLNVPYASNRYSANENKLRNKQTALTEVIFDAQYNNVSKTINNFNTGDKTISSLVQKGMFDYNKVTFDFNKSDPDLIALTNGFAISAYGTYTKITDINVTYTTNKNKNTQNNILPGRILTNAIANNEGYVYFDLRKFLSDGEYFTSLSITLPKEWTEFASENIRYGVDIDVSTKSANYRKNNGMPNVRLVRIDNLPKQYPISKKTIGTLDDGFDDYDKLDVKCDFIYTDVFNNEFTSSASGKSSRIKSQQMYVNELVIQQNKYDNLRILPSDPSTSTYQGGTTKWSNELFVNYYDSGSMDPEREINPVIYYKIYKEYIPELESIKIRPGTYSTLKDISDYGITARFIESGISGDEEYGTLILDFSKAPGIQQGYKYGRIYTTVNLKVKYTAQSGINNPVSKVWFDIPYDRDIKNLNSNNDKYSYAISIKEDAADAGLNSQMYGEIYNNSTNSDYPAQTNATNQGAIMLGKDLPQTWNISKYVVAGIDLKAIAHYPYMYDKNVYSRDVIQAVNDDPDAYLFQSETTIISPLEDSSLWVIYLPVPKEKKSGKFDLKLVDVNIDSLKASGFKNIKVFYTNEENYTTNELNNEGVDTNYTQWDFVNKKDLENATCIKITISDVSEDSRGSIKCNYKLVERKTKVMDQTVDLIPKASYKFKDKYIDPFKDNEEKAKISFTLKDMEINGLVWKDKNFNSKKDADEDVLSNIPLSVYENGSDSPINQESSTTYITNNKGEYKLLVPREGEYFVESLSDDKYVLVKKFVSTNAVSNTTGNESWFDRNSKKTEILKVESNYIKLTYGINDILLGLSEKPVITCNIPSIHVGDTTDKIDVNISIPVLNPNTSVSINPNSTNKVSFKENNNTNFKLTANETGVYNITINTDDGYGQSISQTFKNYVYANIIYDKNTANGTVGVDNNKYYPSVDQNNIDLNTDKAIILDDKTISKTGYIFTGWSLSKNATQGNIQPGSEYKTGNIKNDITLYAIYNPINYTITYNKNTIDSKYKNPLDGEVTSISSLDGKTQTFVYDKSTKLYKNDFELVGYKWSGWNTKKDGSGTSYNDENDILNISTINNENIILYAMWIPNEYDIHYDGNEEYNNSVWTTEVEGTMASSHHVYGTLKNLNKNSFIRKGMKLKSWNTKKDGTGQSFENEEKIKNLVLTDNSSITLYAQWEVISYKIIFDKNTIESKYLSNLDGNVLGVMSDIDMKYFESINLPNNEYSIKGYTFNGWNTKKDGSGTVIKNNDEVTNLTQEDNKEVILYAQWEPIEYNITYDNNISSVDPKYNIKISGNTALSQHIYGIDKKLNKNKFNSKYLTFVGWNTKKDGTGQTFKNEEEVKNLLLENNGNITLYAMWKIKLSALNPNTSDNILVYVTLGFISLILLIISMIYLYKNRNKGRYVL